MLHVNIGAQLELERTMVARGIEKYEQAVQAADAAGRSTDTSYGKRLLQDTLQPIIAGISELINRDGRGRPSPAKKLLMNCEPEKAAFLALQVLCNSFTYDAKLASVLVQIGRRIEDELRFTAFERENSPYYAAIQADFKRKGTQNYRFMHRVLTHIANKKQDGWQEWSTEDRARVGTAIVDIVLLRTNLLQKIEFGKNGKTYVRLAPTEQTLQKIHEHHAFARLLYPEKMPCIIAPDAWTGLDQGGYYTPELRRATPMIKTTSKRHKREIASADFTGTISALNNLQAVPWTVNTEVLAVMREAWQQNLGIGMPHSEPLVVPESPVQGKDKDSLTDAEHELLADWKHEAAEIYTRERERLSRALLANRIIRMADDYSRHGRFWYVWSADFRGRLYAATSGFSPQGPDHAKGLLRFAEGKPLGEHGWYWLRVHGANRFGHDKVSYDARVAWVDANRNAFLAAAADPLRHTDVWGKADKPWQFLAFLFEYRDAVALELEGDVRDFVSHLPVALDGSCNGLQNFSALLRDHVGGAATNLVPADKPADIYSEVARVCTEKLRAIPANSEHAEIAGQWLSFCDKYGNGVLPRSIAKRPVMTLPYGATKQSCTQYVFDSILGFDREFFAGNFKAACWLTEHLWCSIGEVVIAARAAMTWLQSVSSIVSQDNEPLVWEAPDGFRVFQENREVVVARIDTKLGGRYRLNLGSGLITSS